MIALKLSRAFIQSTEYMKICECNWVAKDNDIILYCVVFVKHDQSQPSISEAAAALGALTDERGTSSNVQHGSMTPSHIARSTQDSLLYMSSLTPLHSLFKSLDTSTGFAANNSSGESACAGIYVIPAFRHD